MKWYNPESWFNHWEWLKCCDKWNYARIVGLFCIIWNLCEVDLNMIPQITSLWAALCYMKGIVAAVMLFIFDTFKRVKQLQFSKGDISVSVETKGAQNEKTA